MQLRPEDEAADNELAAFLQVGDLTDEQIHRIRMEQEGVPDIDLDNYSAVIVGGGPSNVSDESDKKSAEQAKFEKDLFSLFDKIIEKDFPYLGACYGLCILAAYLGGTVSKEKYGEGVGAADIGLTEEGKNDQLLTGLPDSFRAFVGHKEACQDLPPGAVLLAGSVNCPIQMIRYKQNIYATQFHPELDGAGLALRINVYRNAGYFPPEDADRLIALAMQETITIPEQILKRFIDRYKNQ